jgi:hypothetical protein
MAGGWTAGALNTLRPAILNLHEPVEPMRSDMAKVLVERPRWGSSLRGKKKGYCRSLQRTPIEDLRRYEPMAGRWRGMHKVFGEHLSPLRRFLRANVGRPWDKVLQELRERVDFGNVVQKHLLTHLFDYVALGGVMIKGKLTFPSEIRRRGGFASEQLYVCAKTGILRIATPSKRYRVLELRSTADVRYLYRDHVWWEVRVRTGPERLGGLKDVYLGKPANQITSAERIEAYGDNVLAIAKRALTFQEVRAVVRRKKKKRR